MSLIQVGDTVRVTALHWPDLIDQVGTVVGLPIPHETRHKTRYYQVDLPGAGASQFNPFPLSETEMEVIEPVPVPEDRVLPPGELYVVSRQTVPTQVEYFGTDKDDRALYREVK